MTTTNKQRIPLWQDNTGTPHRNRMTCKANSVWHYIIDHHKGFRTILSQRYVSQAFFKKAIEREFEGICDYMFWVTEETLEEVDMYWVLKNMITGFISFRQYMNRNPKPWSIPTQAMSWEWPLYEDSEAMLEGINAWPNHGPAPAIAGALATSASNPSVDGSGRKRDLPVDAQVEQPLKQSRHFPTLEEKEACERLEKSTLNVGSNSSERMDVETNL
jgi:hypothetical protein